MTLFLQIAMLLFGLGVVYFSILYITRFIRYGTLPPGTDFSNLLTSTLILGAVFVPQVVLALKSRNVEMTFDGLIITNTLLYQRTSRIEVPFEDILRVSQPFYLRMANDSVLVRFKTPNAHGSWIIFNAKYRMTRLFEHDIVGELNRAIARHPPKRGSKP